jgi:hypothetical protein
MAESDSRPRILCPGRILCHPSTRLHIAAGPFVMHTQFPTGYKIAVQMRIFLGR